MHHLYGLLNKTLRRLEQIKVFDLDWLPLLSSLSFGLFVHDCFRARDHTTPVLGHVIFV